MCIAQSNDGGYGLVGGYAGSGVGGDVQGTPKGGHDIWVLKLTATGGTEWSKFYGSSGAEEAGWGIKASSSGGFIVHGTTTGPADGDITSASRGGGDGWVLKIANNGTLLWEKRLGGDSDDSFSSVDETLDGGVVAFGSTASNVSGDVSQTRRGVPFVHPTIGYTYPPFDYWMVKLAGLTTDLSLTLSPITQTAAKGEVVSYTYTLTNATVASDEVSVKVKIPNGLTLISATAQQGTYNAATQMWDVGTMAVGSKTLVLTLKVN